jgi:hypothetical protein
MIDWRGIKCWGTVKLTSRDRDRQIVANSRANLSIDAPEASIRNPRVSPCLDMNFPCQRTLKIAGREVEGMIGGLIMDGISGAPLRKEMEYRSRLITTYQAKTVIRDSKIG